MIYIEGAPINSKTFPDNSLLLKLNVYNTDIYHIEWKYESDAELFTLICAKRHLDVNYPSRTKHLTMRYLPHARMDRVKNKEDVFTLRYFCEVINSLKFDRVYVLDAHSHVGVALLNNCIDLSPKPYITQAITHSGADVLMFPDEGAHKRYGDMFNMPYVVGAKQRNWETGRIDNLELIGDLDLTGRKVLIIDDICSYGGTFYLAAKALVQRGASNIYLYATHTEKNISAGKLPECGLINKVYTTDSIFPTDVLAVNEQWAQWMHIFRSV